MLPSKFGYCLFILVVFTCFMPIIQAYKPRHFKHRRKHHRRSPNRTHQGIKIVVNRTIINVTTTTNNADSKPKLKSVNLVSDMNGVGDSRDNYNPNPYRNQQLSTKKVEETPHTIKDDRKLLDTDVFKSLLKDLLTRLDTFAPQQQQQEHATFTAPPGSGGAVNSYNSLVNNEEGPRHINSHNARHCVLHGLWLSTVAGAAIELLPEQHEGHIEIHTRIFELPDNPYPPLINSQWTGKGIISQESPTTLTIVFQEHINAEKENHASERGESGNENDSDIDIQLPRTAVFVGQCLVCQGNPTLQGAWVVFPATQTCTSGAGFSWGNNNNNNNNEIQAQSEHKRDSIRMATPDAIYLLRYY